MILEWPEKAHQGWQLTCTAQKRIERDSVDFYHDHVLVRPAMPARK